MAPQRQLLLVPLDLPPRHWAYYAAYAAGVVGSLIWVHWATRVILNRCYFSVTDRALELGREPKVVIPISEIERAVPVAYRYRLFRTPVAEAVTAEGFNILLLCLKNGSRVALAPVSNLHGFHQFFLKLLEVVRPMLKERSVLTKEDIEAMAPRRVNTFQRALSA